MVTHAGDVLATNGFQVDVSPWTQETYGRRVYVAIIRKDGWVGRATNLDPDVAVRFAYEDYRNSYPVDLTP